LLPEVQTLIPNQETGIFIQELGFNAADLWTNVLIGGVVGFDVSEEVVDLRGRGVVLVAVGVGEGVGGCV
jgi:hypothetical protein